MVAYSEKVAAEICERIALGETISSICEDKRMPAARTIWKWRQVHREFDADYERARVDQMHSWANQIIDLADGAEGDFKVTLPLDSPELERIEDRGVVTLKFSRSHVARAALMIDTRKWLMARYAPEDFGTGANLAIHHPLEHKSDEELVQDLRDSLAASGMTSQDLVDLLEGEPQPPRA